MHDILFTNYNTFFYIQLIRLAPKISIIVRVKLILRKVYGTLGTSVIFLIIAFVYSSVGFGGGSSYLAVLAMYNLPYQEMRLTALICNIIVVTGGVYIYIKTIRLTGEK